MEKYILDTSAITTSRNAVGNAAYLINRINSYGISVYIVPSTLNELKGFLHNSNTAEQLEKLVHRLTPNVHEFNCSGKILWEYIQDFSRRLQDGRNCGEQYLNLVAEKRAPGNVLKQFRDSYRGKCRSGTLDSTSDLETVLLSKQLNGILLTEDKGMAKFAGQIGVEYLKWEEFCAKSENYSLQPTHRYYVS